MIKELSHRQGLMVALGDRDEDSLLPLLNFILKHLNTPEYSKTLVKLFNVVLDKYSIVIQQSPLICDVILKISQKLKVELKSLTSMLKVMGVLTALISNKA
jgi:U3 small nucleolar RNA-associated protein 15